MRSLASELSGLNLTDKDHDQIVESLKIIKRQSKKPVCKFCGDTILFQQGDTKGIPLNPDLVPHWKTCPYSLWYQKKTAYNIMRKLSVFFTLRHGSAFEKEAGLSTRETQVIHAVLEREFRPRVEVTVSSEAHVISSETLENIKEVIDKECKDHSSPVPGDLQFKPIPTDPIGDPDEAIAPPEESIVPNDWANNS